jgi:uncharacterized membrane protein
VSQVSGASVNGAWFTGNAENRPVRWHQGQVEELGLAFGRPTALVDVSSAGVAVGYIPEGTGVFDAIVYRNGQYEYLPEPAGMSRSRANSVNNAGDIVGVAVDDNSVAHAVLWLHSVRTMSSCSNQAPNTAPPERKPLTTRAGS